MLCFLLLLCLQKEQHKDLSWMAAIQLPPYWIDVTFGARDLRLCRVTYQSLPNVTPLVVTHSVIIKEDYSWILHVNGHPVDPVNVPSIQRFSPLPGSDAVSFLLSEIDNLRICPGNPEGKYVELGKAKKYQQFLSEEKNVVAYVDQNACIVISDQQYASTVRCSKCSILIAGMRCSVCASYRRSLNAQCSRAARPRNSGTSKKINYR